MAVLGSQDRLDGAAEFMRGEIASTGDFAALTKLDIRAAFNAIDQFMSDNAVSLNSAIPQPARAQLTTRQKAQLLMAVVRKRYLKGA